MWEDRQTVAMANVEVRLGDQRVALKRFQASRRGSGAGVFAIALPVEWGVGGGLVVVVVLLLGARRGGHLVLVYRQPIRAATAVGSALSLLIPYVAVAGGIPLGSSPSYYWEIADPLGTGMVMLDEEGARVRHQTFSPFGRVHAEVGGSGLRTFYAGHRRDEGSGMFYMQARWYDPGSGRFLSVDPLHFRVADHESRRTLLGASLDDSTLVGAASDGGARVGIASDDGARESNSTSLLDVLDAPQYLNAYSYALNNPLNAIDPTGEIAILTGLAIVALSAAGGAVIAEFFGGSPIQGAALAGAGAVGGIAVTAVVGATTLTGTLAVGARALGNALVGGGISAGNQVGTNVALGAPVGQGVGEATAKGALFSAVGSLFGDFVEAGLTSASAPSLGLGGVGESTGAIAVIGASTGNTAANAGGSVVESLGSGGADALDVIVPYSPPLGSIRLIN